MATQPESAAVSFDGVLSIRNVESARRILLDALHHNAAVAIDLGAAESIDLSFIQLLLAARLSAVRAGKRLTVALPPGPVLGATLMQGGFVPSGESNRQVTDPLWAGAA